MNETDHNLKANMGRAYTEFERESLDEMVRSYVDVLRAIMGRVRGVLGALEGERSTDCVSAVADETLLGRFGAMRNDLNELHEMSCRLDGLVRGFQ